MTEHTLTELERIDADAGEVAVILANARSARGDEERGAYLRNATWIATRCRRAARALELADDPDAPAARVTADRVMKLVRSVR